MEVAIPVCLFQLALTEGYFGIWTRSVYTVKPQMTVVFSLVNTVDKKNVKMQIQCAGETWQFSIIVKRAADQREWASAFR